MVVEMRAKGSQDPTPTPRHEIGRARLHGRLSLMEARDLQRMSIAEYIALDRSSDEKWEYVNGEAFAMSGASPRHNAVSVNILKSILKQISGPCFPLHDGQKVETEATGSFHYPDISIVCGKPRYGTDRHALTNPSVLFEILSPSTGDYDRGAKFDHYRTIPELREYVIVFVETRRVEHRKRLDDGRWLLTDHIGGDVPIEVANISLSFDEIYENLERVDEA